MNDDSLSDAIKAIKKRKEIETIEEQETMRLEHARRGILGSGISNKPLGLVKIRKDAEAQLEIEKLKLQFPIKPHIQKQKSYGWTQEYTFEITTKEGSGKLIFPTVRGKPSDDYYLFHILIDIVDIQGRDEGKFRIVDIAMAAIINEFQKKYVREVNNNDIKRMKSSLIKRIDHLVKGKIKLPTFDRTSGTYRVEIKII